MRIKFRCPKQLKFHGKLNSNQYADQTNTVNANSSALDKYITYEYDEHDYSITFIVQLPNEGQYGLDLYARDPEYQTERRTMSHCCKYIINYSKSSAVEPSTTTTTTNNNNHLYHDYSFDSPKSRRQQKMISPRDEQLERSLSPRKFPTQSNLINQQFAIFPTYKKCRRRKCLRSTSVQSRAIIFLIFLFSRFSIVTRYQWFRKFHFNSFAKNRWKYQSIISIRYDSTQSSRSIDNDSFDQYD